MRTVKTAALASLALGASSLALVAAPAHAASAPLAFSCAVAGTTQAVSTVIDTDAPATAEAGTSIANLSATMDVPEGLVTTLNGLQVANVEGAADVTLKVGGEARTVTVTVPRTPVPATGSMKISVTGALGAALAKAGVTKVEADKYTAKLKLTKADGTPAAVPAADLACTPPAADLTVDSVTVTKATTTTTARAKAKKKGKAVVKVRVAGADATGKVVVKAKPKKGKAVKAKGTVANGKATLKLKGLKKGKYKVSVTYKGDANNNASKDKTKLKVKK